MSDDFQPATRKCGACCGTGHWNDPDRKCVRCDGVGIEKQQRWQCVHFRSEWEDCAECIGLDAESAHRTAIDLVLAHLKAAASLWCGQQVDPSHVLMQAHKNITVMRDWTPEHAAEVLREARGK